MTETPVLTTSVTSLMSPLHDVGLGRVEHARELIAAERLGLVRAGSRPRVGIVHQLPLTAVPPVVAVRRPLCVRGYRRRCGPGVRTWGRPRIGVVHQLPLTAVPPVIAVRGPLRVRGYIWHRCSLALCRR